MWLADDDEIADSNYIQELVNIHNSNSNVATAFANWKSMKSPESGKIKPMRDYTSESWLFRALKFNWFAIDDFFYGLHKTDMLRNATKLDYWTFNENDIINWAYPFLLDMVLQGKIIGTNEKNITWINHEYTSKTYTLKDNNSKPHVFIKFILRRTNVHYLYGVKILKKGGIICLFSSITVSILSLAREFIILPIEAIKCKIRRYNNV